MYDLLAEKLIYLWEGPVAQAYQEGRMVNLTMLQAAWYRHLDGEGQPPLQVWLSPRLVFFRQEGVIFDELEDYQLRQWLSNQQPALLVTRGEEIVAIAEISFSPDDYVDYRRPVRRLVFFHQLAGRAFIHLGLEPESGRPDPQSLYEISPNLLCVYALVTRFSALALDGETLRREHDPQRFPRRFLHLRGSVRPEKIAFSHALL